MPDEVLGSQRQLQWVLSGQLRGKQQTEGKATKDSNPRSPKKDKPHWVQGVGGTIQYQPAGGKIDPIRENRVSRVERMSEFPTTLYIHACRLAYVRKQRRRHVQKGSLIITVNAASGHMQIVCSAGTSQCRWTHSSNLTMANSAQGVCGHT